jgi:hypothetical protein
MNSQFEAKRGVRALDRPTMFMDPGLRQDDEGRLPAVTANSN